MNYLLDTNAWIRFFEEPELINENVRKILANETRFALSPFNIIEVCQKVSIGKLSPKRPLKEWLKRATLPKFFKIIPITSEIAQLAYTMKLTHPMTGKPHKDPADLIIAATAQVHKIIIVTSDKVLLVAPFLKMLSTR